MIAPNLEHASVRFADKLPHAVAAAAPAPHGNAALRQYQYCKQISDPNDHVKEQIQA